MSLGYLAGPEADAALMAAYVDEETDSGFDDLFDDGVFRAAQATFQGQGHQLAPRGQTTYRGSVQHAAQGLPADRSAAHQAWVYDPQALPGGVTPQARARAARRLAFAVAQDSSRGESPGWLPQPRGGEAGALPSRRVPAASHAEDSAEHTSYSWNP